MHVSPWIRRAALALTLLPAACGPASPDAVVTPPAPIPTPPPPHAQVEAPPLGRLPADTRPTRYRLELRVDPARPRFEGEVDIQIELDRARDVIWMHGHDLQVTAATVQPEGGARIAAKWEQVSKTGVAALRPEAPVGPGKAVIHLAYTAAFATADEGFGKRTRGGDHYAVTQFEATHARWAFPCFDEPAFKTPYEVVLHVPAGQKAIANTREISRAAEEIADPAAPAAKLAYERVAFAPTEKLPSYLVAFAVGPFDVVDGPAVPPNAVRARPIPLRGVAARGRGKELTYALAHSGALVAELERYFGIAYPYDKLDLIAVPEKGGAMENAGAITFGEALLMLDEKSPVRQRTSFASVTAHELAHQWFGDLVTMTWWDDLWLNEAFATWAETRVVAAVSPELRAEVGALFETHDTMSEDSRLAARKIRQEIESDDDIENAFDGITYGKGAAVIAMFERWMGREAFQKGIRAHLAAHAHGNATSADLLAALSTAAGRDVATPFRTFLDQPGLPFVEARVSCEGTNSLVVQQSRFLPLGSTGDLNKTWQIPVCARYADGKEIREACALLTEKESRLPLPSSACPAWVMPNADAAGYYRWSLAPADTKKLAAEGLSSLSVREKMSFAESVQAGFARGTLPGNEAIAALAPLAADKDAIVAGAPIPLLASVGEWLHGDPRHAAFEAFGQKLYAPLLRAVGWTAAPGEPTDRGLLRADLIDFLAVAVRDRAAEKEAVQRGRAWVTGKEDAVATDLLGTALAAAMRAGDAAFFDALVARLGKEVRPIQRRAILRAIGSATQPALADRARALVIDPAVHLGPREIHVVLFTQLAQPALHAAAWAWTQKNVDAFLARLPERRRARLVSLPSPRCEPRDADEVTAMFQPHLGSITGGPRALADATEEIRLCAARRAAQEPRVKAYFDRGKKR